MCVATEKIHTKHKHRQLSYASDALYQLNRGQQKAIKKSLVCWKIKAVIKNLITDSPGGNVGCFDEARINHWPHH